MFRIIDFTMPYIIMEVKLDEICRANHIKFFCGDVWGYYGYFFTDLGEHDYVM